MLLLIQINKKSVVFTMKEFTIHFATINTIENLKCNTDIGNLQYTLLLLILYVYVKEIFEDLHLQYTLLLLIPCLRLYQ